MSDLSGFTVEAARRNRISEATRQGYTSGINQVIKWAKLVGKGDLVMMTSGDEPMETLNLRVFLYRDFLDFIVWVIREKSVQVGTLNSYRSSVKSLYKDQNIDLPEEYGEDMKMIFSGIRKTVAQNLQSGDKNFTGKRPLTFMDYESLCKESLALSYSGFTHLYLILSWNLMCRSKSTETITFDHISSENDAIGFTFHKTKTAQEGTKNKDPKHCFANPMNPFCVFICGYGDLLGLQSRNRLKALVSRLKTKSKIDLVKALGVFWLPRNVVTISMSLRLQMVKRQKLEISWAHIPLGKVRQPLFLQ
ncbi:hypothetical protein AeNC1_018491, partial [Aphanomyces euteiches]